VPSGVPVILPPADVQGVANTAISATWDLGNVERDAGVVIQWSVSGTPTPGGNFTLTDVDTGLVLFSSAIGAFPSLTYFLLVGRQAGKFARTSDTGAGFTAGAIPALQGQRIRVDIPALGVGISAYLRVTGELLS
jgi:hypothetical protein